MMKFKFFNSNKLVCNVLVSSISFLIPSSYEALVGTVGKPHSNAPYQFTRFEFLHTIKNFSFPNYYLAVPK